MDEGVGFGKKTRELDLVKGIGLQFQLVREMKGV